MGTPDFAVPSLKAILDAGYTVSGVFTQPDKPQGRGYKLQCSPIKELALQNNIPVFQPKTLKSEEQVKVITELAPDLIVVVAYGKLLPASVLNIPKFGCINVHGSLLPKYRGAAPIQWTVLNGDKVGGVTTMFMNEGLDTGDILLTERTNVGENETSSELYDRLSVIGAALLIKTIEKLEHNELSPVKQDDSAASYAPMLSKETAAISFDEPSETVHHLICGLSDWPCAYIEFQGKRLKLYSSRLSELSGTCYEILDSKRLIVACKTGSVELTEVQFEGSKRMSGADFMNGRHLKKGDLLR